MTAARTVRVAYTGPHVSESSFWRITKEDFALAGKHDGSADGFDHPTVVFNAKNNFTVEMADRDAAYWLVDNHEELELADNDERRDRDAGIGLDEPEGGATGGAAKT